MKLLTFKGGIHPPYNKEYTNQIALRKAEAPKVVYIPLQQHIGAPAKPIVEVGDEVKKGQKNWRTSRICIDLYTFICFR